MELTDKELDQMERSAQEIVAKRREKREQEKKRRKQQQQRNMLFAAVVVLLLILVRCAFPGSTSASPEETLPSQETDAVPSTQTTVPKVDRTDWRLILVNPWNKLPEDHSVTLATLSSGHCVDERVYSDLKDMLAAAEAEGLEPVICSSYRDYDTQYSLYHNKVDNLRAEGYSQDEAEQEAAKWVAIPGTSEHHTGLAVDIVAMSYQLLDEKQETTAEQIWLMENSYKFGFILRYPSEKSELTGIHYEPWHYRYVGKEVAKEIYEQGICLEEYLSGD